MSILQPAARGAMCIVFAATLAGFSWGNSEADQRKAFIAFLQDINNRPGVHVPVPNANDEKAFGPNLQHYAIILDFNRDIKQKPGTDLRPAPQKSERFPLVTTGLDPVVHAEVTRKTYAR